MLTTYKRALRLVSEISGEPKPYASPDARFSAACAAYWALTHCYAGQGDPLYAELCVLGRFYKPSVSEGAPEADTVDHDVYEALCSELLYGRA